MTIVITIVITIKRGLKMENELEGAIQIHQRGGED